MEKQEKIIRQHIFLKLQWNLEVIEEIFLLIKAMLRRIIEIKTQKLIKEQIVYQKTKNYNFKWHN